MRGSAYLHDRDTGPYGMCMCMGWAAWTAETCSIASAWLHMGWWAGGLAVARMQQHRQGPSGSVTARCWRFGWTDRPST